jgi:hypothetical protein
MRFLQSSDLPVPPAFAVSARFVIDAELRRALFRPQLDVAQAQALVAEAKALDLPFDHESMAFVFTRAMTELAERCGDDPDDIATIIDLAGLAELA